LGTTQMLRLVNYLDGRLTVRAFTKSYIREFAWEPPGHVTRLFAVRKQRSWLSGGFLVAFDLVGKDGAAPNVHGVRRVQYIR